MDPHHWVGYKCLQGHRRVTGALTGACWGGGGDQLYQKETKELQVPSSYVGLSVIQSDLEGPEGDS